MRVFAHPYFAVTDADGNYKIENAPTGELRMKIWHGTGGWLGGAKGKDGRSVSINAGDNALGDLPYPPPG